MNLIEIKSKYDNDFELGSEYRKMFPSTKLTRDNPNDYSLGQLVRSMTSKPKELYTKVLDFATKAHEGQKRKYSDEDYITHPIAVAKIVEDNGGDITMILAALLHDVIEDTDVTDIELLSFLHDNMFSITAAKVFDCVIGLTDIYTSDNFPSWNRAKRKGLEAIRLGSTGHRVQTIKYADLFHNTLSITASDPKFAKIYLAEKKAMLDLMVSGDSELRNKCVNQIKSM
jgi:guanosine-3',5'-bis(diphosphate) 3'-pyrophosphohydrolase